MTTPAGVAVWNTAAPLPSTHMDTVSSSPGSTGLEKPARHRREPVRIRVAEGVQ